MILDLDDSAHVLAVGGELLSIVKFPVKRENTGKFPGSSREGGEDGSVFRL